MIWLYFALVTCEDPGHRALSQSHGSQFPIPVALDHPIIAARNLMAELGSRQEIQHILDFANMKQAH